MNKENVSFSHKISFSHKEESTHAVYWKMSVTEIVMITKAIQIQNDKYYLLLLI